MAAQRPPSVQTPEPSKRTLRLTFEYERQDVRLVAGQRVAMIPPPSESQTIRQGQAGFWIELRDADERILYQRVLHNPIRHAVEEPGDETARPRWHKIDNPRGTFQLLVPDLPHAQALVLFSSPSGALGEPATELVRFRLEIDRLDTRGKP